MNLDIELEVPSDGSPEQLKKYLQQLFKAISDAQKACSAISQSTLHVKISRRY